MNIEWSLNQKMEAVVGADHIAFYARTAGNGAQEAGRIEFGKLSTAIRHRAMTDGLKKRVNDGCANKKTAVEIIATAQRFCDHYNSGTAEWNLRTGEKAPVNRDILFAAIATVRGKSEDAVHAALGNLGDDVLRQFFDNANIAAEYVRRTKPTTVNPDVDAMLDAI